MFSRPYEVITVGESLGYRCCESKTAAVITKLQLFEDRFRLLLGHIEGVVADEGGSLCSTIRA